MPKVISITLAEVSDKPKKKSALEEIRQLVKEVDLGIASQSEWKKLDLIFTKLKSIKNRNPKQQLMYDTIVPVMEKYHHHLIEVDDLQCCRQEPTR